MSVALLDGDIIAFRSAVKAQEDVDWGDGQEGKTVNTRAAIYNAKSLVKSWTEAAQCDEVTICLSPRDGGNFRKELTEYKGGRPDKPVAYWNVVDALEEEFKVIRIPKLEADDVMGILSTSPKLASPVIVSIDKDMKTIPGRLYNPIKTRRLVRITPRQADLYWMTQTLTGDKTDGYAGCPGIGPVKADAILAGARNLDDMWRAVVKAYAAKGLTEEDALLQARLARILRRDDYDKEKGLIYLWHPKPQSRPTFNLTGSQS